MTDSETDSAVEPVAHVEIKAVILLVLMGALVLTFLLYIMYARGVFENTQRAYMM